MCVCERERQRSFFFFCDSFVLVVFSLSIDSVPRRARDLTACAWVGFGRALRVACNSAMMWVEPTCLVLCCTRWSSLVVTKLASPDSTTICCSLMACSEHVNLRETVSFFASILRFFTFSLHMDVLRNSYEKSVFQSSLRWPISA